MVHLRLLAFVLVASCASTGHHQEIALAPNAPQDRPIDIDGTDPGDAQAKWNALVAPYVEQGRATYPEAKRRYLAGLPPGHTFFVTTILRDHEDHFENVFVVVDKVAGQKVTGRIATQVNLVRGYRDGQLLVFPESDLIDWLISKPDGSEEGNYVGKFLDTLPRKN